MLEKGQIELLVDARKQELLAVGGLSYIISEYCSLYRKYLELIKNIDNDNSNEYSNR